ncbi:hypothetical protein ABET51_06525 [Metabacillus fastidiosus]|nr:hypothetical protein [Metabacillus fastidiosus]
MASKKKTSIDLEKHSKLERYKNDRHNDNASAAAALEPQTPRIYTDNL